MQRNQLVPRHLIWLTPTVRTVSMATTFLTQPMAEKTQVSMSKPKQARIDNQWLIDANSTAVSSLHCSYLMLMLRDGAPPEAQLEASYPCEQGDRPQLLACLCTITQANLNLHNHQRATILRAGLTVREMPSKIFRVHIPGPRRRPATRQST